MTLPQPLRRSRIAAAAANGRFRDVRTFGIVASTNDVAHALASRDGKCGLVVVADGQTEGRGRRGMRWASPAGSGLFLSAVIERPRPGEGPLLAGAAGVAAAEAIRSVAGAEAGIKWPNDLWVDGHKVGGVLIEVPGGQDPFAIAGIGITLRLPDGVEPAAGAAPVAGLSDLLKREIAREALAASLLDRLDAALGLASRDPDGLRAAYRGLDVLLDREIVAEAPGGTVTGRVAKVDLVDGIELVLSDGSRRRLKPEHAHVVAVLPRAT